jgi:hypothetical protein
MEIASPQKQIPMNTALKTNNEIYERMRACLATLDPIRHPLPTIRLARTLANFASFNHSGRFCDGAIDNRLLRIGEQLNGAVSTDACDAFKLVGVDNCDDGRRKVLHLTTSIHRSGGVSPSIVNWILNDQNSQHTVVVTDQRGREEQSGKLYPAFIDAVELNNGFLYLLPANWDLRDKSIAIRSIADLHADIVLLHHYPEDLTPILAFAKPGRAPVAVVNSSDHNFWSGSSVTDSIVNLRTISLNYSRQRRAVSHNVQVPIPLQCKDSRIDKESARRQLGIPSSALVLISIGRGVKYLPYRDRDFMKTATKIVSADPNAHLYIVGFSCSGPCHDRIHAVGPVEHPELYQAAADIYLEGFPFGSQTALLESALAGLPAVLAFDPIVDLLVTNDDAINNVLTRPTCEHAYIAQAVLLMEDCQHRREIAAALEKSVREAHLGQGWIRNLECAYSQLERLTHRPAPIPETDCVYESADLELAQWGVSTRQQWLKWMEFMDLKYYHYPPGLGAIDHEFLLHNTLVDMERAGHHQESIAALLRTFPLVSQKSRSIKGIVRNSLALTQQTVKGWGS